MSAASRQPAPCCSRRSARSRAPAAAPAATSTSPSSSSRPRPTEAEAKLWDCDPPAGAAQPQLRLGDLRRRRLDPRAHPPHRPPHPRRDRPDARRPPDLRRRPRDEVDEVLARVLGRRRAPHRGPARRSARRASAAPTFRRRRRLRQRHRTGRRASRAIAPFEISVGVYPEKHPESPSIDHDIDVLKAKVDAGATRAISQFFFDIDAFLRFVDQVRAAGVTIPIVPGIMPVTNFNGLQAHGRHLPDRRCPAWLANLFDGLDKDPETRRLLAGSVAAEMCARLEEEGFTRLPLLHPEPRRPGLRHLPRAGPARGGGAEAGMTRKDRIAALKAAARERILILDGSWGVMIQSRGLSEDDFRGERFAAHNHPLKGDNDLLCLTRPDIVTEAARRLFRGRRRHRRDQHLHRHRHRPGRLRAGGRGRTTSTTRPRAWPARAPTAGRPGRPASPASSPAPSGR